MKEFDINTSCVMRYQAGDHSPIFRIIRTGSRVQEGSLENGSDERTDLAIGLQYV